MSQIITSFFESYFKGGLSCFRSMPIRQSGVMSCYEIGEDTAERFYPVFGESRSGGGMIYMSRVISRIIQVITSKEIPLKNRIGFSQIMQ